MTGPVGPASAARNAFATPMKFRMDTSTTSMLPSSWSILIATAKAFSAATAKGDDKAMTMAVATIIQTMTTGAGELYAWRDLRGLRQWRAEGGERERKRRVAGP